MSFCIFHSHTDLLIIILSIQQIDDFYHLLLKLELDVPFDPKL